MLMVTGPRSEKQASNDKHLNVMAKRGVYSLDLKAELDCLKSAKRFFLREEAR